MGIIDELRSRFGSLTDHALAPHPVPRTAVDPDESRIASGTELQWPLPDALDDLTHQRIRARVHAELFGVPHEPVRVGRFHVVERLGKGGMGVVYGAIDPELDRKVALKLLADEENHGGLGERLRREAKALARLSHPGIVHVYEVGEHEGHVFLAMELVDGPTLREWLETPRRTSEIVDVFVAAARALASAHAAGLVHRDFKPDNVIVDRSGRPRLLDFGLAQWRESPTSAAAEGAATEEQSIVLTRSGALAGTPAYMSPEQLAGSMPDPRSDQFSFCVVLWEALWGTRPFHGDTLRALAADVTDGPRDPPTSRRVPGWLRAAIVKGLSVHPEQRHASMDVLVAELSRERARRRIRQLAVGIGLVAVSVGGTIWTSRELAHQKTTTRLRSEVADERIRAAEAEGTIEDRTGALHLARARNEMSHDPTLAMQTLSFLPDDFRAWNGEAWQVAMQAALRGVASRRILLGIWERPVMVTADAGAVLLCVHSSRPGIGRACDLQELTGHWLPLGDPEVQMSGFVTSPAGDHVAVHDDTRLWWHDRTRDLTSTLTVDPGSVIVGGAYSADGTHLAIELAPSEAAGVGYRVAVTSPWDPRSELRYLDLAEGELLGVAEDGAFLWWIEGSREIHQHGSDGSSTVVASVPPGALDCIGPEPGRAWIEGETLHAVGVDGVHHVRTHPAFAGARACSHSAATVRTAVTDSSGRVLLVDADAQRELEPASRVPRRVEMSVDGAFVLVQPHEGRASLYAAADGSRAILPEAARENLAISPHAGRVVTLAQQSFDEWPLVFSPVLVGHDGPVDAVRWSASHGIVSGGADGTLRKWQRDGTSRILARLRSPIAGIGLDERGEVATVVDGDAIRSISLDSAPLDSVPLDSGQGIRVDDSQAVVDRRQETMDRLAANRPVFSRNGLVAVARRQEGLVLLRADGKPALVSGEDAWHGFAITDDGAALYGIGAGSRLARVDVPSMLRTEVAWARMPTLGMGMVVSHDGMHVAMGRIEDRVWLYELERSAFHWLESPADTVVALEFSPDDRLLAGAAVDGEVFVWETKTRREVSIETGLPVATAIAFDPSGSRIAIAGEGPIVVRELPVPTRPRKLRDWVEAATDIRAPRASRQR
jgi:predicted Ser/Thr protein kinase